MAAHWKTAEPGAVTTYMNALPKLVASRTLTEPDWNNTTITADIGPEIERLKKIFVQEPLCVRQRRSDTFAA